MKSFILKNNKAKVGIEPALTALQAAALPLCHLARLIDCQYINTPISIATGVDLGFHHIFQ